MVKNNWRIIFEEYHSYDILHCQTDDLDLRLSFDTKFKKGEFFLSTKNMYRGELRNYNNIQCPKCGEVMPERILLQVKLLSL